jgi:hypothetical protein
MKYNKHDLYIYVSDENLNLYSNMINGLKNQFEYAYVIKIKEDKMKSMVDLIAKFLLKHHSLHIFCETMYFTYLHKYAHTPNIYILNLKPILSNQNYICAAYKNGFKVLDLYNYNIKKLKRLNCSNDLFHLYPQIDFEYDKLKFINTSNIHITYTSRRFQIENGNKEYNLTLSSELKFLNNYKFEMSELHNLKMVNSGIVIFLPDAFEYNLFPYTFFIENILKGSIIVVYSKTANIREIPDFIKSVVNIFNSPKELEQYLVAAASNFEQIQQTLYTKEFFDKLKIKCDENFKEFKKII